MGELISSQKRTLNQLTSLDQMFNNQETMKETNNNSVTWYNIPITRVLAVKEDTREHNQTNGKRVTWSDNLCHIKVISPRQNKENYRFPSKPSKSTTQYLNNAASSDCNHFVCGMDQPYMLQSRSNCPSRTFQTVNRHNKMYNMDLSTTTNNLGYLPHLQTIVEGAANIKQTTEKVEHNYWKPDRSNMRLGFEYG